MEAPFWALASGCIPDADPWDIPQIAHAAGFKSCGMWVDPETKWQGDALQKTATALYQTGIKLIDVEAVWLQPGVERTQEQVVEAGIALGARNVLVVSRHDDETAAINQFRALCDLAGDDIRIVLEFGEFTQVKNLGAAQSFIQGVDHPAAGILIDLMHINRSGDPLPDLDNPLYPYIQACDFWQNSGQMSGRDYIEAAVDSRCPIGEGEASRDHLTAVCSSALDVSLEIRSKALRDQYPNPYARARQIFERNQRAEFSTD
jgi:sugar phosphate isomerase/epimerase